MISSFIYRLIVATLVENFFVDPLFKDRNFGNSCFFVRTSKGFTQSLIRKENIVDYLRIELN